MDKNQCLNEIINLRFAVSSLVAILTQRGSNEGEVAKNAEKGISARLDYLHGSIVKMGEKP
jgi:hypothetical protein